MEVKIEWDIELNAVKDMLDKMSDEEAVSVLGKFYSKNVATFLTAEDLKTGTVHLFKANPEIMAEFVGLPNEEIIPDSVDAGNIADYLSDKYGYCVKSFVISEKPITEMTAQEIVQLLSPKVKDDVYRLLWSEYLKEDVETLLYDNDSFSDTEKEDIAEAVVTDYVYNGKYCCTLSYWTNLENLINAHSM